MGELRVCFYSGDMETILDQTLSPRYGGAEWRTYITARAMAADPCCSVCLAVDKIPSRRTSAHEIDLHLIPKPLVRDSLLLTWVAIVLRGMKAIGMPPEERASYLEGIRSLPPINTYGVLEKVAPRVYDWLVKARWSRLLRKTGSDWHVVWWNCSPTYQAVRAARLLGKHSAIWLSSDIDIDWDLPGRDPQSTQLYRWALRHADLVLAQSEHQRRVLASEGVESHLLPTGIEIGHDTGHEVRDNVLWVASCQRVKQPELFLELARRLPLIPFTMIMTRRSWSADQFDELATAGELIPNLEIIDGVADLRPYYDRAAALVNMSTHEGFPNTFLEAAVSSTPVIALNVDPDGMLSGGAGITCGGDFELVVRSVAELYGNAEARSVLGATARAYVAEHHDIVKVAAKLKALMQA
ncbi:MAG: glycosyltransferase family 4 protein [Clostridiales bacterium]|nr:glycosyltransferase family 4 protein [Clostridiales bacterium]